MNAQSSHTWLDVADESCRLLRATVGARRTFSDHLRTLTTYLHFETWERLILEAAIEPTKQE